MQPIPKKKGRPKSAPKPKAAPKKRGRPKKFYGPGEDDQSVSWDFTEWDMSPERLAWWQSLAFTQLFMSIEICPDTGTPHYQCRIVFTRGYRFVQLKKIFPPSCHFEATLATADFNYGRKWDSVVVVDIDNRKKGCRTVFAEQRQLIADGANLRSIAIRPETGCQSFRSAEILMAYIEPPRAYGDVIVKYIDDISEAMHESDLYRPPLDGERLRHWTGYDAHESVVLDCALHKIDRILLRQLVGPAPFTVRVGFGIRQARFKRLYVLRPPDDFQLPRLPLPVYVINDI